MPTDAQVQRTVDPLSDVGKLVHLAFRYDIVVEDAVASDMLKQYKSAYEDEITRMAAAAGCQDGRGNLTNSAILDRLGALSKEEAASVTRTYNRDLSSAITAIRIETPRANRNTYRKRLLTWDTARGEWKDNQIGMHIRGKAVGLAQQDFLSNNRQALGKVSARFFPRLGLCPICDRLVKAGNVEEATMNSWPTPIHPNCPHVWVMFTGKIDDCSKLWVGQ